MSRSEWINSLFLKLIIFTSFYLFYFRQIFFLNRTHIYYTSNSPNSTAKLLFDPSVSLEGLENFVIDHAADRLCWIADLKFGDALSKYLLLILIN